MPVCIYCYEEFQYCEPDRFFCSEGCQKQMEWEQAQDEEARREERE